MNSRALLSPRLRLEPVAPEHLLALVAIQKSNRAAFHGKMSRQIESLALAQRWLVPNAGALRLVMVQRTGEKAVLGMMNLGNIAPMPFSNATLGYWMDAQFSGQGYAREAAQRLLQHAFGAMKLHRVEANIAPDNARSIRLVRALGFRKEGTSPRMLFLGGAWRDQVRFAITREEWNA